MLKHTAENRDLYAVSASNYFSALGRWLWFISFWLQTLLYALLIRLHFDSGSGELNNPSSKALWHRGLDFTFRCLPTTERLLYWSFWMGLLSCWWNPRWVECCKGRSKKLVGFPKFYACQVLSLVLKSPQFLHGCFSVEDGAHRPPTQVLSLAILAVLALYLYNRSPNLIRTKQIIVWQPKATGVGGPPPPHLAEKPPPTRDGGEQTMADILDEILNETETKPASNPALDSPAPSGRFAAGDTFDSTPQRLAYNPNTAFMSPNPFKKQQGTQGPQTSTSQGFGLGGLSISDGPMTRSRARQAIKYDTEMDWSPTQSQHRAFNSFSTGSVRKLKFGETPVQDRPGVFWAKVPPAPTTPAQRVFNPPNAPVIRAGPSSTINDIRFQGGNEGTAFGRPQAITSPTTEFAAPKLLLRPKSDERDFLADMFSRGFSLDPEPEDDRPSSQPQQGQSFAHNLAYLVLGLGLAIFGNWAYSYWLSTSPAMTQVPLTW